jgi:GT2 family glycosyltransferase
MRSEISVVVVTRNRKDEVLICLKSIVEQTLSPNEIILVDNSSNDDTSEIVKKKFPRVIVVKSNTNLGGAGGRNLGLDKTKGDYILFLDDDTKADKNLVKELAKCLDNNKRNGIVQPKIYEMENPNTLQGVGHDINLLTGRVIGIGVHVKDIGQYQKEMKIPMVGCTWMVKRKVFEKIGKYDEDYFIPYEDSDFSIRASRAGFQLVFVPTAKIWHKGVKGHIDPKLEWIGITTPERSYRVSRNKIIFMKKHAPSLNFLVFLVIFTPIYTILHSLIIISSGKMDILISYWKGLFSGLGYMITH